MIFGRTGNRQLGGRTGRGSRNPGIAMTVRVYTGGERKIPMKVTVLFFGWARELTGFASERLELPEGEALGSLLREYQRRFPRLDEMRKALKYAVNQEFATPGTVLRDGDEIAFLPPVGGGAPGRNFYITREPISAARVAKDLETPADGAVVTFEGIVRDNSHGRAALYLEYEAYEPMAEAQMKAIGEELRRIHKITGVVMAHRIGRLEIGEVSVAIAVAAPHRAAAFDACRAAIDRVKQTVPIWKKEHFADGAVWAEGEGQTIILAEAARAE